jgi:hypothetical protein
MGHLFTLSHLPIAEYLLYFYKLLFSIQILGLQPSTDLLMAIEGELDITTEQLVKDSAMMEKSPDSMITVVSCVVHSRKHRSLFQHLINNLRNAKIVPKTFMNKIPRLICTCKKEHFHEYFGLYEELNFILVWF